MERQGCYCQATGNLSLSTIIYLFFSAIEGILGVLLNAFIVIISCINWARKRHLKSIDKILMALGISKLFYTCMLAIKIFLSAVFPCALENMLLYHTSRAAVWFLTCTTFCFSACLSVFYCVKIANFQNLIFTYLKTRISRLVPCLLLLSVLGSVANTSPFFLNIYNITCMKNNSLDTLGNYTLEDFTLKTNVLNLLLHCGIGFSVVFVILITSAFLLLFSLRRHTQQMRNGPSSSGNPSMAAHFRAVKMILSLLSIDSINFLTLMLLLSNIFPDQDSVNQLCVSIVYITPCIQSNVLIWGNFRLRKEFVRIMRWVKLAP